MKKLLIIFIVIILVFILTSIRASAFSFVDIFRVLNKDNNQSEEEEKELTFYQKQSVEDKYQAWKNAFNENDIKKVFLNDNNFVFSQAEINHLITKRLGDMDWPPVKDVKIYLKDGQIEIRGYSIKKFFKGKVELDIAPKIRQNRLALEVKRARFRNIYFPSFVASYILKGEMEDTINFLYSHPDYKKIDVVVEADKLELKYSKQ